ncbi:MAG: heavy-metal-associated domain-containing protein [Actinomycetota bacterium]|nr:heavy-metal-associated domain-containing protein [Actinomycetota bacterium]
MTTTTTFKTPGMHCPSCSMLIEMNVGELTGIESVTASRNDGTTVVTYDATRIDESRIASAIRTAGYEAEIVS